MLFKSCNELVGVGIDPKVDYFEASAFHHHGYQVLAKHFRALVWEGLGLDTHPQLRDMYFGNYSKVMYFSQVSDDSLIAIAKEAAEMLGLNFEHRHVGVQGLEASIPVVFQSAAKRNVSVN